MSTCMYVCLHVCMHVRRLRHMIECGALLHYKYTTEHHTYMAWRPLTISYYFKCYFSNYNCYDNVNLINCNAITINRHTLYITLYKKKNKRTLLHYYYNDNDNNNE